MTGLYNYINLASNIKRETWGKFSELFEETSLKKGEYFIKEGELASQIGFLTKGVIRAFYRDNRGVEYNKHFFTNNNFVAGYSSLITGTPNLINQQALTDCKLFTARYKDIELLYE
ncbi:MAG: Crp/Fnr family transcriptional regulator, partial [Flavobacteriaceae bacterium]